MFKKLLIVLGRFLLSLRYRIHVKGIEYLKKDDFPKPGGLLLLPNHPSELDPAILMAVLPLNLNIRPLVVENFFNMPWIYWLLKKFKAIPIPNFSEGGNQYKRRQTEMTFQKLINALNAKENLLIYPAGKLKLSGKEEIGGASGIYTIVQGAHNANIVLVRTTGLWGSSFSTYLTSSTPDINHMLIQGIKILLSNLVFFTPRRHVTIEFAPAPADFPQHAAKLELNRYLEGWYNEAQHGQIGESPTLVPYHFWSNQLPIVRNDAQKTEARISQVPEEVHQKVIEEIARIAKKPVEEIQENQQLSKDLGLDSLDALELSAFLDSQFEVSEIHSQDMASVGSVLQLAAAQSAAHSSEIHSIPSPWPQETRPQIQIPHGETIVEVFLRSCERLGHLSACGDDSSGILSYQKLKIASLLLAKKISRMPGEHIGILLPASVGCTLVIFACLLAKKIPVMMNWTLGSRHLQEVAHLSGVTSILSSSRFLSRAKNMDLEGVEELLVLIEEIRREIGIIDKLKAVVRAQLGADKLLASLGLQDQSREDIAVLLFTSGTESKPKGVPLSNKNILSNQRAALGCVEIFGNDIMYSFLPPFHSFGFTVTTLLPILAGFRAAYFPDPTDGPRLARAAGKWKVTIICGAPTFIRTLVRCGKGRNLKTVRLFVSGAEKTPHALFEQIDALGRHVRLIEGYGITECGPILTLNRPERPAKGVGQALPGVDLLIVHPETLKPLPIQRDGLVLARGPNIFKGYLSKSIASPFVEIEGRQWYQTGDLGSIDEEGYLVLSGRLKRFVKIGGEMVNLNALEEAMIEALPRKGFQLLEDVPSIAICSVEKAGEKTWLILFAVFPISLNEANNLLKEEGFSNLIKFSEVRQIPVFPLLGTGKVNYQSLNINR